MINELINTYSTEVIGGLLVSVIILSFNIIKGFIKGFKLRKKYSGYIKNYYLYWYSTTQNNKIQCAKVSLKNRFGKLYVTITEQGFFEYKGTIHISENNIYISVHDEDKKIEVHLIFFNPLNNKKIKKLIGSMSSISALHEPIACLCILNEKKMSELEARSNFTKIGINEKNALLKVEKDNSLYFDNLTS